ncbi:MAG: Tm-1-like ATP-binding domain-containing protein [Acidobacteriota bacterium]
MKLRGPILLVGTLDTKGEEILYLRERLLAAGAEPLVIDVGVLDPAPFGPDVSREEIARRAGTSLAQLLAARDRGRAVAAMERGLAAWIRERHAARPVAGVLAIGGSAGTTIATTAMRELPVGVPKLMVSTLASGNTRPYVGTSDIAMMYSVADFTGLNRLTRTILGNAANAMLGMCGLPVETGGEDQRPLAAATMFGVTTPCVNQLKQLLEKEGFELLVFHATGTGGQAMEQLIRDGFIRGVLDITTTELADELAGGILSAGPHRLEAAGLAGVPQVVSVGALDMVNFGPLDSVPERFRSRKLYQHNPTVTLMRTTAEENAQLGRIIAEKLNASRGPVALFLPLKGVSAIDAPGQPFHDTEADQALFEAIRTSVGSNVKLVEVDAHINDPAFAARVAAEFLNITGGTHDA